MASELGVLDIDPKNIKASGRLEPGKIFFIDTKEGRIVQDDEIKKSMAERQPYGKWLSKNLLDIENINTSGSAAADSNNILSDLKVFDF